MSPIVSGDGSGGSQPVTRELLHGPGVTVADGGFAQFTWAKDSGDDLLDLSAPTLPLIVAAGVYVVSVSIAPLTPMTPGGWFQARLDLDRNGEDPAVLVDSPNASVAHAQPFAPLMTLAYYIPAGGSIRTQVFNFDGAAAVDFRIDSAVVQRVS